MVNIELNKKRNEEVILFIMFKNSLIKCLRINFNLEGKLIENKII